jgi:hypothetical protein
MGKRNALYMLQYIIVSYLDTLVFPMIENDDDIYAIDVSDYNNNNGSGTLCRQPFCRHRFADRSFCRQVRFVDRFFYADIYIILLSTCFVTITC